MTAKTALITGASSGIGEAFAEALAKEGSDLILVARSKGKLEELAKKISTQHGRRVEVIALDLGEPSPGARVAAAVATLGMTVDLLVNNAGFGDTGAFVRQAAQRSQQMMALNCGAVVDLTHAFLPGMVERGSGGIINVASLGAFQPLPYMAVYGATKAFVLSFSDAVWAEVRKKGIKVLAVCPGPVDTPFFNTSDSNAKMKTTLPAAAMVTADKVVRDALRAFKAGKTVIVPGVPFKIASLFPRAVPRKFMAAAAAMTMKR